MARPPGNPNWKKGGASPNPGGRPKAPVRFRELYDRDKTDDFLYERLRYWASCDDGNIALKAIALIFERRYGRAATVDDNGDVVQDQTITVIVPKYDEPDDR